MNTKSENNVNKHVVGLITMHWQRVYAQKSEVSIYKIKHNQNFTLHKVAYLQHLSYRPWQQQHCMRTAELLHLQTQGF